MHSLHDVINSTPYKAFIQSQLDPESVLVTGNFKRHKSERTSRDEDRKNYLNEIGHEEWLRREAEYQESLRRKFEPWDGEYGQENF